MEHRINELDLTGLRCPHVALAVKRRIGEMREGDTVVVQTTDPAAPLDLSFLAQGHGHIVESIVETPIGHKISIRIGPKRDTSALWPVLPDDEVGSLP